MWVGVGVGVWVVYAHGDCRTTCGNLFHPPTRPKGSNTSCQLGSKYSYSLSHLMALLFMNFNRNTFTLTKKMESNFSWDSKWI